MSGAVETNSGCALRAGVVGLGMIGGGVAQSLARRGRHLGVYDLRPDAATALGLPEPVASPAALARGADVVLIAVVNAVQVRAVLCGPEGLLAGAHEGLVVVILSTIEVAVVRELAEIAAARGVQLIDAGVTGGNNAASGRLVTLVGGEVALVERIRPVLEEFSQLVLHMGPLGSGMAGKIARNMITYGAWHAAYEAGKLAEAAGVDLQQLVQAVRTSDPKGELMTLWLATRGTVQPMPPEAAEKRAHAGYVAQFIHKDLHAAFALAGVLGVEIPGTVITEADGDGIVGLKA